MHRSASLLSLLIAFGLVAAFPGCGEDDLSAAADASADGRPPPVASPYGLDSRPPNPTCKAPAPPPNSATVDFNNAFPRLTFTSPVGFYQAPGDASRFFVLEQGGRVRVFPNKPDPDPSEVTTFADISTSHQVDAGGEKGLLGLAFHPKWPANPSLFLSYTRSSGDPNKPFSRITKFVSTDGGATMPTAGSIEIFDKVQQPFANHNGGSIAFGKDGFLYYGLGDGGSGNDPLGSGQDKNSFLGKVLRIDIDKGSPYAIPPTNPFANGGGKPEIFAYGIRNPWKFTFDRDTDDLWLADVGQNQWEEVDKIQLGGNYGWKNCEGTYQLGSTTTKCTLPGAIDPVVEYKHGTLGGTGQSLNAASITGGYVYRGKALPALVGAYIYGDFAHGQIWSLLQGTDGKYAATLLTGAGTGETNLSPSAFGQDQDGEVYVVSYGGRILKMVPKGAQPPDTFPKKLSETGCMDPANVKEPASGLIPYGPISPLWSDGAEKRRWIALPDGATIDVRADGDFDFPKGTVLVKSFYLAGKLIETRLFMRHNENGEWAGYTYEWNADETDAILLGSSKLRDLPSGQQWSYPSRGDCMTCHTAGAGRSLGLELAQLNNDFVYPNNRLSNQLATFEKIGLFSAPLPADKPTSLRDPQVDGDLTQRARSYLHTNCSSCHRPQGGTRTEQDMRFTTKVADMKTCNLDPKIDDLGVAAAKLLLPGDPDKSILSLRMHALDVNRMPQIGTRVVDTKGVEVVDSWIKSLTGCN
jgi:uncharacterized repeat protein (TIGR03806 family)